MAQKKEAKQKTKKKAGTKKKATKQVAKKTVSKKGKSAVSRRGPSKSSKKAGAERGSFPIVGIGASAGGFEAMSNFLEALPADTGMAFVFLQHLAPEHESALPQLLSKKTTMPVLEAKHNATLKPDTLYVIPPASDAFLSDGKIKLTSRTKADENVDSVYHPIDAFFSSLAEARSTQAVGIILSGTASDGTLGLQRIKEMGGITMAQDDSAKYKDMPRSAQDTGMVDVVGSPQGLASELARISKYPLDEVALRKTALPSQNDTLKRIFYLLKKHCGVDFTEYKRTTTLRRIERRRMLRGISRIEAYAKELEKDASEIEKLYQDLLIGVTSFFRSAETVEALKGTILPALVAGRYRTDALRIWVPGCASGEEAYTIAITVAEFLEKQKKAIPVQIFASDLNQKVIEGARAGVYSKNAVSRVSRKHLGRYFKKSGENYQVSKEIRDMCIFAPHNFLADPPFSNLDLISCQNVLIYMETPLQQKAMRTFHYALKPAGFLILGKSESIGAGRNLFSGQGKKLKIFTKKEGSAGADVPLSTDTGGRREAPEQSEEYSRKTSGDAWEREADKLLLSKYVPAGVIINGDFEILQFRGEVGRYLDPKAGKASLNLLKMVKTELEFDLRDLVHQAKKAGHASKKSVERVLEDGRVSGTTLEIIPMNVSSPRSHFLILFKEEEEKERTKARTQTAGKHKKQDAKDKRIAELERARDDAREQVKTIHEEYEATNEELQSTNEEVLSSNEELQSLNEELETSKEELQSTNEELTTVNDEVTSKNEELEEARDYSDAIIDTVRESLLVLDADLRVKTANKAYYRTFETSPEKAEGELLYRLGNDQWDIPRLRELLTEILPRDSYVTDFEVEHTFPTIGARTMLLNARQLQQKRGNERLLLLAIEDMTERKIAERQQYRLASIVDSSEDVIVSKTLEGIITSWNRGAERILGYTAKEAIGKHITLIIPQELFYEEDEIIGKIKKGIPIEHFETTRLRKDGSKIALSLTVSPIKNSKGEIVGASKVARDITSEKAAEAKLLQLNEQLKKAVESKDEFIALASHELKTPLTTVKTLLQILAERFKERENIDDVDYLERIENQAKQLELLVNDLLDVSRIKSEKFTLNYVCFDFDALVKEVAENFQFLSERHTIRMKGKTNVEFCGDRERVAQILTNFVVNAVKYSPKGKEVIIKASSTKKSVKVSVTDFGIGIKKSDQEKIFERFSQVSKKRNDISGGLGIGLFISKTIADRHNGKIKVESAGKGKGTTFTVTLPLDEKAQGTKKQDKGSKKKKKQAKAKK